MTSVVKNIQALTNARSIEELWDIHTRLMAEFGFHRVIYAFTRYFLPTEDKVAPVALGDPQDWVVLSNIAGDYLQNYIEQGYYEKAPMFRWALQNDGARSWSCLKDPKVLAQATEEERAVIAFNYANGVKSGYTLSFLPMTQRSRGVIALIADPDVPQDTVDAIWEEHGEDLTVLCNVMHLKILALPQKGSRKLTKRQREVLQWVGDGKTTQDIAILLGLTAATIEKHLRLAREALDVETTAQAVLKATLQNQMFILDA